MTEIKLIYTEIPEPLDSVIYDHYLQYLPDKLKTANARYRRWQDRHLHLFGKILLIRLATEYNVGDRMLSKLQYTSHRRPYLPGSIDFNISHTGTTVACAIARDVKIGLDIEIYSQVDFSDFTRIHSEEQWNRINTSDDPQKAFFETWTVKESVIKADGKGLSIPLDEIMIDHDQANSGGQIWHLKRLNLEEYMACCVACDQQEFNIISEKITQEQIYARNIC